VLVTIDVGHLVVVTCFVITADSVLVAITNVVEVLKKAVSLIHKGSSSEGLTRQESRVSLQAM
jgi:hypothetical protein